MSDAMGTKEASEKWGYSAETIRKWCKTGLLDANQDSPGSPWHIPKDAVCPRPVKTKKSKQKGNATN